MDLGGLTKYQKVTGVQTNDIKTLQFSFDLGGVIPKIIIIGPDENSTIPDGSIIDYYIVNDIGVAGYIDTSTNLYSVSQGAIKAESVGVWESGVFALSATGAIVKRAQGPEWATAVSYQVELWA